MRFDVVVWGATGFTGALVAEYLARTVGVANDVRWAIAGRSEAKLAALRDRLAATDPKAHDLPGILADASDPESLGALARQATVVCSTVGPYARVGSALVAACVAEGAHYCDITGEPQWVRAMIDAHHAAASDRRLRIVHCCGYDSIPSDLGCLLAQDRAREALGRPLPVVRGYVRGARGGSSGGTVASLGGVLEEAGRDRTVRRILGDPYSLLPEGAPRGPRDVRDLVTPSWDAVEGSWVGPTPMGPINAKVVRRSHALLGQAWGDGFRYDEVVRFGRGPRAWGLAQGMGAGMAALAVVMSNGVGRRLAGRFLPEPGEGPGPEQRERGWFRTDVVARGDDERGRPVEVRVQVRGKGDPGYKCTSGMLAEAALCLARDTLPERYGVLTPASAMGAALTARLPRAGVTFDVEGP